MISVTAVGFKAVNCYTMWSITLLEYTLALEKRIRSLDRMTMHIASCHLKQNFEVKDTWTLLSSSRFWKLALRENKKMKTPLLNGYLCCHTSETHYIFGCAYTPAKLLFSLFGISLQKRREISDSLDPNLTKIV